MNEIVEKDTIDPFFHEGRREQPFLTIDFFPLP